MVPVSNTRKPMTQLDQPTGEQLLEAALDISRPQGVQVECDGRTLHVNVDGVCVLRVSRSPYIRLPGREYFNASEAS